MNRIEEAISNIRTQQILWDNLQHQYQGKKKGEAYCYRRDLIKAKMRHCLKKLKVLIASVPIYHIKYGEDQEIITAGQTEEELRSILGLLGIRDGYIITQIKRENIKI